MISVQPSRFVVANRTFSKAEDLTRRIGRGAEACPLDALEGLVFDLVINATSAGIAGESIQLSGSVFGKEALAYDMVYGRDTPFLALARACGCEASDGLGMLVEQAAESFHIWRGVRPETRNVIARLRAR